MNRGENTKAQILEAGLEMASRVGLECVTIGSLAKNTGLSKSGLFAHFQSKENLQLEILNHAARNFTEHVIVQGLRVDAGIPRIKAVVDLWIDWSSNLTGGCIFVTASTEFSDRPGRVRETLLHQQEAWIQSLIKLALSAIRVGDFQADMDCKQFAFDLYSLLLGFHYYHRMLHDAQSRERQRIALDRLLEKYRSK